ncbi:WecB/TagA/CpsF family glycosyltransferase [Leptolyngbya sp. FACHB-261]|uniref:WecB/TagA/CpsF family glycosyltransferase n=1 Tax=Leptolyngbya sp. FACHB-261 TaxID=2692806 RepID=UPI001681E7C0|nr:WecB/TagA/CpsF family glycosyltransferase [Leptolyngbya sp. FACHB-261]MBD2105041.1 WecB/TagA/CpsF family glycosyltransferase [Leptolyngbya sp. FACHB-261]
MNSPLQVASNAASGTLPSLEVQLLGRRITCVTVPTLLQAIHTACVERRKITIFNYNVHSFNLSMQLPWFYESLQNSDITHCDSMGILWAIRFMGLQLPIAYRVSYTLLMPKLLEHCNQHGLSVFLLGSRPEHLEIAIEQVHERYPNVKIAGHHGYFSVEDAEENNAVVEQINQAKAQVLIVGMGMPIQENWVRANQRKLNVNAIMVGGAVIDRLAGVVPDCPTLISNLGLEWFYRLSREPKRLWVRYIVGNLAFVSQIVLAKLALAEFSPFQAKVLNAQLTQALTQR